MIKFNRSEIYHFASFLTLGIFARYFETYFFKFSTLCLISAEFKKVLQGIMSLAEAIAPMMNSVLIKKGKHVSYKARKPSRSKRDLESKIKPSNENKFPDRLVER